jgi:hypothetical protein
VELRAGRAGDQRPSNIAQKMAAAKAFNMCVLVLIWLRTAAISAGTNVANEPSAR